ncbi:hypothetical protein BJY52DRAFT_560465 [Lactarius psammicola]|nr:hypothetical protein BJY52DRAFT_560465 [Lactarius psammicola]
MHPQKLRTFSNVTPIQPGMITMVDLGDTSRTLGPFVVSTHPHQHLDEDQARLLFTPNSMPAPMIDLRKITQLHGEGVYLASAAGVSTFTGPNHNPGAQSLPVDIKGDEGIKLPRQSVAIKRTGISTRWYITMNPGAIERPPILHTTTDLEMGDLFINKYISKSYNKDVLQVWLLCTAAKGEGLQWSQVRYIRAGDHVMGDHYIMT